MKKPILLICLFVSISCGQIKYVPINNQETVNVRDSVVLRDSTVITYLQKERIKEIVPELDTLVMTTTYAISTSYLDTTHRVLRGKLEQIDTIPVPVKIVYKDKIITREKVVEKEVPVEVVREKKVTPKWIWWSLGLNILVIVIFLLRLKFKDIL